MKAFISCFCFQKESNMKYIQNERKGVVLKIAYQLQNLNLTYIEVPLGTYIHFVLTFKYIHIVKTKQGISTKPLPEMQWLLSVVLINQIWILKN